MDELSDLGGAGRAGIRADPLIHPKRDGAGARPSEGEHTDGGRDGQAEPVAGDEAFTTILEALPHMAFLLRADGSIAYANAIFRRYVGSSDEFSRICHPEDVIDLSGAVRDGAEPPCEVRLRRHDGLYRWHAIHVRAFGQHGLLQRRLGTAIDIDEMRRANELLEAGVRARTAQLEAINRSLRRQIEERARVQATLRSSEEKFRNLYNRTPIALHSSDKNATIIEVNDGWLQLFGYSREEVLGRSPPEFMTEESARLYRERAWPDMLNSSGTIRTFEYQFIKKSGEIFDASLSARGEWDAEGKFVRTWAATTDITALKKAEAQLRQMQKLEAVGQLTGGVAHDFNNLLMVIIGNLETAQRTIGKSEPERELRLERLLATAMTGAQRAASLTQRLLAFARRQALDPKPINANELLAGMAEFLRRLLPVNVVFRVVTSDALWNIEADRTELEAAILNLIVNARDAMPSGGELTVKTANIWLDHPPEGEPSQFTPGEFVSIAVADTGTGMSADVVSQAFEPFFTTKPLGQGTGLGLSQVYGFIKQSGGHVRICSTRGTGTTVQIYLPRYFGETLPAGTGDEVGLRTGFGQRILVVEDDPGVRDHVVTTLRELQYEVIEAATAEDGLRLFAEDGRIDLVLTDMVLPGLNGADFATAVRAIKANAKIVYMTGYSGEAMVHDGRLGPGIELLHKPVSIAVLAAKIHRMLQAASA